MGFVIVPKKLKNRIWNNEQYGVGDIVNQQLKKIEAFHFMKS